MSANARYGRVSEMFTNERELGQPSDKRLPSSYSAEPGRHTRRLLNVFGVFAFLLTILLGFIWLQDALLSNPPNAIALPPRCGKQKLRQEWRTLTAEGKGQYIRAVQCLAKLPSRFHENATAYDDLPWLHAIKAERE